MSTATATIEEIEVEGHSLLAKVNQRAYKGNMRQIKVSNKEGEQLIEIPLIVGIAGALLLPVLAAVGAIAALITHAKIQIGRDLD